jgi:hypothetical protein
MSLLDIDRAALAAAKALQAAQPRAGPGTGPIIEAAVSVFGAIMGSSQQGQANKANAAAQDNQNAAIGQESSLAQQLATGPYLQSLIDAEGSGVKTLQSTMGGVPNEGALIEQLFGDNVKNALGAALTQRSSNLSGAAGIEGNVANQYAGEKVPIGPNPWVTAATSIASGLSGLGTKPSTTGPGPGGGIVIAPGKEAQPQQQPKQGGAPNPWGVPAGGYAG